MRFRLAILVLVLDFLMPWPVQAAGDAGKAYLDGLYLQYKRTHHEPVGRAVYTTELAGLIERDAKIAQKAGGPNIIEMGLFCGCQDDDGITFQTKLVSSTATTAVVRVTYGSAGPNTGHFQDAYIVKYGLSWRISDFVYFSPKRWSLLKNLKDGLGSNPATANGPSAQVKPAKIKESPLMLAANATLPAPFQSGTFRFGPATKQICNGSLYGAAAPTIASARGTGDWVKVAKDTMDAGCGADIAYYLLGEAAEHIGYRVAAYSYFQEASRIASTSSFRFSEHCTLNKGATGFQSAGRACFDVPIEAASREAVFRTQASASLPTSATSGGSGGLGLVVYEGAMYAGFTNAQQQLHLQIGSQQIVGRMKSQMGIMTGDVPVTGTYSNGRCTVSLRDNQDMVGTCDSEVFTGEYVDRKTARLGRKFWYATASRWAKGRPAELFPDIPRQPEQFVTATGRDRILIEPGNRCGPQTMLLKGYCFDEAIGYLQQNLGESDVVVITSQQPLPLGARIVGGQYLYVRVKRNSDGSFSAERNLHGSSKVQVPQGCMFRGSANEGFIIDIARGRKSAIEATDFRCG